ncbi:efflux RND transporter periplasmic adaptor subunit [Polaribacter sp. 20A6]|uniref:efflux RND transporter periplasmic adaptor subunit n=1 Tax=Polaribacter sp. 20A6 TaxID=2687289 RepID=UPI0013FD4E44|nr:efflux RND transporter periplasmic adaptor subunit [Polaribacter sp. 20A6]
MKKTIITGIIVIGALILIALVLTKNKKENEVKIALVSEQNAAVSVKVDTVKTDNVLLNFSTNGNFEPIQQLTFSAENSGKVIRILVKEGDKVKKGQTLAIVRSDIIDLNAQATEATYQNALNDYARFQSAFKTGGVTQQQLDQAKLNMVNTKANYTHAKINLGDTKIKSPINGIINKKMIEIGSILTAVPSTSLFEIVNVSKLKLKVTVNESQVANLKVDDIINVTTSVFPDKVYEGKITFIAPKSDGSLNFPVEIQIENNIQSQLKAGMYGTANFSSKQQKQDMIVVPRNAFVGSVNSNQIFIIENDIAKLVNVTSGRIIGNQVEILKGLSVGQIIVTTGQINLEDGNTVEIIK